MKFGNWNTNEEGIIWQGKPANNFRIPAEGMLNVTNDAEQGSKMYECIVNATAEEWLTDDDLYDLTFAFVYLAGTKQKEFDYQVLDQTLAYQFDLLEEEEEED
jgi:hypothetical protein